MNPAGQRAEVRDSLQLIVRQLDMKVIFQTCKQIERLQAVNSQRLKEVVVGSELGSRDLKMCRREVQDFFKCLFRCRHDVIVKLNIWLND